MRIASLTLEAFKSFAGKVELTFPGNIIAIVGPNGAGKSNICDAIAWVLGEQSAKLLRSQTMGEVIFAGSAQRPAAAAAQVTLTLSFDHQTPEHRLEISRRIFRDGTSEYRLGGRRVRLKDVQDKLAEAGLATRAYAIIEQGRISQVLSTKPTDRRALFEEAAGISHYRLRRHEAELKLAETKANLERVSDIVAEVRREYRNIRRQAREAQRYVEIKQELEQVRRLLLLTRWYGTKSLQETLERELGAAEREHAQRAATLARAESELERMHRDWEGRADALAKLREQQSRVAGQGQRLEAEEAAGRRELDALRHRHEQLTTSLSQNTAQIEREKLREQQLTSALTLATQEVENLQRETEARERAAGEALGRAREAEARAEEARQHLLQTVAATAEARDRFHRAQLEVEQIVYQQTRLASDRERLVHHLQQAAREEEEAARLEAERQAALDTFQSNRQELQSVVDAARRELAALTQRMDALEHRLWQTRHEREAVQRARAQLRAVPQNLAKVLKDEHVVGTVADFLNPTPDLAGALDEAYGHLLTLPVVAGEEAAQHLLESAPGEDTVEVAIRDPELPPPTGSFLASAGVESQELGWLAATLPPLAVAADPSELRRLAEDPGLLVLWPGHGLRQGQRLRLGTGTQGPKGALQLKSREQELLALEAQLAGEKQQLSALIHNTMQVLREHEGKLSELSRVIREHTEALAEVSSKKQAHHRERTRLERELEALEAETVRLASELTQARERLTQAETQAQLMEARAENVAAEVDEATTAANAARTVATQAQGELDKWRGQLALAQQRSRFAQKELEHHRQLLAQLSQQGERVRQELADVGARTQQVQENLAAVRTQLEQAMQLIALNQEKVAQAEAALVQLKEQVEQHRVAVAQARDEAQRAHQNVMDRRLRAAEITSELAHLEEDLGGPPTENPPGEVDPQVLEAHHGELQRTLAQMGPVNELAIHEEHQLAERFRFLSAQKKDLERSLESLQNSIAELDSTCRQRFMETFTAAKELFLKVFRELFGGGDADLQLIDPESPLDSGIEIKVRPPGKHTQSVLLLSGGEKALAAVALLLALFRIRPAPFCVLDEVDAPLDDLNVERLCQHLKASAHQTQFLLITHNRRTMAHADVLYGVTMEEPGVSRVVSVRLEEA